MDTGQHEETLCSVLIFLRATVDDGCNYGIRSKATSLTLEGIKNATTTGDIKLSTIKTKLAKLTETPRS